MYYLIGRDLDADGQYEFIKDMDKMILTEDPASALQVSEEQLEYIDMAYLNAAGFYALEADRFQVSILEKLLFSPIIMGYRPPVAPPPRPRRRMPPPPPHRAPRRPAPPRPRRSPLGMLGAMFAPEPKRGRRPDGPKPAPRPEGPGGPRGERGRGPGAGRKPGGRGPGR